MSHRVLVSAPYLVPVVDRYRERLARLGIALQVAAVGERLEEHELLPLVPGVDGVICGDDRFTDRVLRAATRLKVISKWGTGTDSIDRQAAERLGILVCNTPGAFTDPVADSVMGYLLCFARRIPWSAQTLRTGGWQKQPSIALREGTLGIIGVGAIGRAVARRAAAFGMTVLGVDIRPVSPEVVAETGLVPVALDDLLGRSDFVSVNCDLNPTSRRLLDASRLARMKAGAVLINTARGGIVDERALIAGLEAGRLGGAALDVFEIEPLPADSPLRRMDNVLLAAHNANSSPAAWTFVHERTIRNLLDGLGVADLAR